MYVDGYVLPVPKKNLSAYRRMSQKAGKIFREHGALEYRECAGDDLDIKGVVPFSRRIRLKPGETIVFAWILFKSRAHRDSVNAKVMKDQRLAKMKPQSMPWTTSAWSTVDSKSSLMSKCTVPVTTCPRTKAPGGDAYCHQTAAGSNYYSNRT